MKKRIKVLITVFAVAAMCFAFTACGGEDMSGSPYVGTWTATSASYAGMEMSISDLLDGEFTFTLEDNGKCEMNISGEKDTGKWSETYSGFKIADEFEATVDGDTAVLEYEGVTIKLERK